MTTKAERRRKKKASRDARRARKNFLTFERAYQNSGLKRLLDTALAGPSGVNVTMRFDNRPIAERCEMRLVDIRAVPACADEPEAR